jgi:HSF-type DNA-binding
MLGVLGFAHISLFLFALFYHQTTLIASWFNMTKFSSFQRQLNIYSFKRIRSGTSNHLLRNMLVLFFIESISNAHALALAT